MKRENENTPYGPDVSTLGNAYQTAKKAWFECRQQIALLREREQQLLKEADEAYLTWFEARRQ